MDHIGGVTLHDLTTLVFWGQILQLILIDLILSGDNAVLIALACRNLPSNLQKKGITYGVLGAISLRIAFVFVISMLLKISFLKAAGGLLLLWIAVKLVIQDEEESEEVESPDRLWAAVKTIIMADAVMSLDNVMAIAGVSGGKMALVLFGLLVSLPLVVYGSRILMVLMNRFPWIITLGAAILGWTAGEMFVTDHKVHEFLAMLNKPWLTNELLYALIGALSVIIVGEIVKQRARKKTAEESKETMAECQSES